MNREKRPIIGHWVCSEGGRAEVTQTVKRGNHFNTKCDCCGFVQGTGAKRQTAIWQTADFFEGATVIKPANVSESDAKEINREPEKAGDDVSKVTEPEQADFDPSESVPEPESKPEAGGKFGFMAVAVLVGSALGGYVWTRKQ